MAHCTRCGRVPLSPPLLDPLIEDKDGEREEEEDGGADESGERAQTWSTCGSEGRGRSCTRGEREGRRWVRRGSWKTFV